jgi:hypothetical protein
VKEGGEERAGVMGALLTYCKGPGKDSSWQIFELLAELKLSCDKGRAIGKGYRSEGDSESNMRLADVRRA